jgi:hypothetical protein
LVHGPHLQIDDFHAGNRRLRHQKMQVEGWHGGTRIGQPLLQDEPVTTPSAAKKTQILMVAAHPLLFWPERGCRGV